MFRCLSLLGAVALALGVAALASLSQPKLPSLPPPADNDERRERLARRVLTLVRVPGPAFHARLSAN
jgi:hypothetical protein